MHGLAEDAVAQCMVSGSLSLSAQWWSDEVGYYKGVGLFPHTGTQFSKLHRFVALCQNHSGHSLRCEFPRRDRAVENFLTGLQKMSQKGRKHAQCSTSVNLCCEMYIREESSQ